MFSEEAVRTLRRNIYVNDCLKSIKGETKAISLVSELRALLSKGGFRLTKWISNSRKVIESVLTSERAVSVKDHLLGQLLCERALGTRWDVETDTFGYKISLKEKPFTRQGILSVVSSIYDPLGFVAPFILPAKCLLQNLCRKGLGWDDIVSNEDITTWQGWLSDLPKLESLKVYRCFKPPDFGDITTCQIHHFADASQIAYGAVSYLRITPSPFLIRRGRTEVKRYGVLYTCLVVRAVHIEVAHNLDTDSFLNSFRRFVARRGSPELIRSDNGGNFVSGERELNRSIKEWNQEKIADFLLQKNVQWAFNPPCGSHHGGPWERCIRTVRKVLNALVREQVLDDEGLSTFMCEAESIINNRPLTKVSDDARDLEPLTPNHLLLLRYSQSFPPGIFAKEDIYSRRRWRQVQYLSDVFWRRWVKEYLPTLQGGKNGSGRAKIFKLEILYCSQMRSRQGVYGHLHA